MVEARIKYLENKIGILQAEILKIEEEIRILKNAQCVLEPIKNLTPREIEIRDFILLGYTYKEIAIKACISVNTVKKHVANIYAKTGTLNRKEYEGRC